MVCVARGGNAEATAAAIVASGGKAEAAGADVTDAAAVEGLIKSVVDKHGKLDILVSNAGITRDQLMLRMKRSDWDDVVATNLTASFTLCQAALKPMIRARSGRIRKRACRSALQSANTDLIWFTTANMRGWDRPPKCSRPA